MRSPSFFSLALLTGVALTGCSTPPPGVSTCVPGMSTACVCASGASGAQVCQPDGTFSACSCAGTDAGPGVDAAMVVDSGGPGIDAASDVGPDAPAVGMDAGTSCGSDVDCADSVLDRKSTRLNSSH